MWKRWLERLDSSQHSGPHVAPDQLAVAVLLLECARADFASEPAELEAVREALAQQFGLSAAQLDTLIGAAGTESQRAISLHGYVTRLNRDLPIERRRELIGTLWRVAWADGRIDPQEEGLLRKLADLLYVSHADLVRSKLEAQPTERPA